MTDDMSRPAPKGRGASANVAGRLADQPAYSQEPGSWPDDERAPDGTPLGEQVRTEVRPARGKRALTYNSSPDLPFDRSLNPYKGCEHGCIYCFARPGHVYQDLSPGLDFETKIYARHDLPDRLRDELAQPSYRPATVTLGADTDPYQPVERDLGLTRACLAVLAEARHPVCIVTKSGGVLRDRDLLQDLARYQAVRVMVSVTTREGGLARKLEPRAAHPERRLATIEALATAGIPVGTLMAPIIPGLTDWEIERVAAAVADAGASSFAYVLLRLPHEVAELMGDWLARHYPDRKARVESLIRQCRAGGLYDHRFGKRLSGDGPVADMIAQRVAAARKRYGLAGETADLSPAAFQRPQPTSGQLNLL